MVAGMLRVALRAHGGRIKAMRMAARIGARRAAVVAGLRWMEAQGKIALRYQPEGLWAYSCSDAPPEPAWPEEATETERTARQPQAERQAADALVYLLRETRAYRRAYTTESVEALLAARD